MLVHQGREEDETYWNQPNASGIAEPVHFALLLTVEEVIMVLHAHKLRPAILLSHKLHLRKLHRPHTTRTDVPDLSALNQIMERLHCLL